MTALPKSCFAPWANLWLESLRPKAFCTALWAIRPRVRMVLRPCVAAISLFKNSRHVLISSVVGLFCGGTQRTALVMRQLISVRPSSMRLSKVPLAKPNFFNVGYNKSPA